MPTMEDTRCVTCGYLLKLLDTTSRCPECGTPARISADRYLVKSKIREQVTRAIALGVLSLICLPFLAPVSIYFGIRAARAVRAQGVGGYQMMLAGAAVALGVLGLVPLYFVIDMLMSMMRDGVY